MSSPEARSAFHDSTCAVALVGASTAQQSSLSDRKSPPVSAASSDTAVPPPRPATEAVAARFEYGGVRAGSWFGKAVWIALDPARFLLDWERAIAWGLDPNLDLVRLNTNFRHLQPGLVCSQLHQFEIDLTFEFDFHAVFRMPS